MDKVQNLNGYKNNKIENVRRVKNLWRFHQEHRQPLLHT